MDNTTACYVQVRTKREFDTVRHAMEGLAPVRASGRGTASDPTSYWFEVVFEAREATVGLKDRLLTHLQPFDVSLQRLQPIPVGMGATLANQMDLFGGA
jgi:hypothetical protein